jgi:hypothetical protein
MTDHALAPVQVHVVADSKTPARDRKPVKSAYGTFLLTAKINAVQILPPSDDEREAVLMACDTDIVIAADLQAAAGGYGTTVPQGYQWIVKDQGAVYAGATLTGTNTSRVSVSAIYYRRA